MDCTKCWYCICVGILNISGEKLYECHKGKPKYLGTKIKHNCKDFKYKGNVIRILI